jgi:hypothetical protein
MGSVVVEGVERQPQGLPLLGVVNSEGLSDAQYLATSGRARFASLRLGVA